MAPYISTALALAILASVTIALGQFLNSYTQERYRRVATWVLIGLTIVYGVAANVFLVIGLAA